MWMLNLAGPRTSLPRSSKTYASKPVPHVQVHRPLSHVQSTHSEHDRRFYGALRVENAAGFGAEGQRNDWKQRSALRICLPHENSDSPS